MHAAAMFITASECAEAADTYGARQYFTGVRDAFETIFRYAHDIDVDEDPYVAAVMVLAEDAEERDKVMAKTQELMRLKRRASVGLHAV